MKKVLLAGLLCVAWAVQAYAQVDVDVSSMVQVNRGTPTNNYVTKQTSVFISVKNNSAGDLQLPIRVTLDSISPSSITSANADGMGANGKPYFYLSFGGSSFLRPGETSSTKVINFNNPNKLRFNFTTKAYISVNAEGAAIIGSASGGSVEVSNPLSPLYGVTVGIPAGSLATNSSITISNVIYPPPPPPDAVAVGPCINFSTSSNIIGPVALKIPITLLTQSNLIPIAKYFNSETNLWEDVPSSYNYIEGYMIIITNHFSDYGIFYEPIADHSKSLSTNYNIGTDSLVYQNEEPHPAVTWGVSWERPGYCGGMSAFTQWYYEYKGHGVRCTIDNAQGKEISGFLQENDPLFSITDIMSDIMVALDWRSGNNAVFNYLIQSNKNSKLARIKIEGKQIVNNTIVVHSVLIVGWHSYSDTPKDPSRPSNEIGYFDVIDGNHNKEYGKMYFRTYYYNERQYMEFEYNPTWWYENNVIFDKIAQTPIESLFENKIEQKYNEYAPANGCPSPAPPVYCGTQFSYPAAGLRWLDAWTFIQTIGTQTLTADKSPYYLGYGLGGEPHIEGTLTIEPGVVVKVGGWYHYGWYDWPVRLSVSGKIIAHGTVEHPVIFTSVYDQEYCPIPVGDAPEYQRTWGGFYFISGGSVFEQTYSRFGGNQGPALTPIPSN